MIKPYYYALTGTSGIQVHDGPCVIYAIELNHTTDATLDIYNHASTTTNQVYKLRTSDEKQSDRPNIPDDGFFFPNGCHAVLSAGTGTVIWYPA